MLFECFQNYIREFGADKGAVKALGKHLPAMFQHADKNVRGEATGLAVELFRWAGRALEPFLESLKPIQVCLTYIGDILTIDLKVKELQEQFAKVTDMGTARPIRLLRSQQGAQPVNDFAMEEGPIEGSEAAETNTAAPSIMDAYELADPVRILDRLPASFEDQVESAKWSERKEALEALLQLLKTSPKLEEGSYGSLVQQLVKRLADANVLVVVVAAGCLEAMARGLRKSFGPSRTEVLPALLERCKERKVSVLEALRSCLDAMAQYVLPALHELSTEVLGPFLAHKNPQVRVECLSWISRSHRKAVGRRELKGLISAVLPGADDGSPEVRDAAARCLATFLTISGETTVAPLFDGLDKIRLARISELVTELKGSKLEASAPLINNSQKRGAPPGTPVKPIPAQVKPSVTSLQTAVTQPAQKQAKREGGAVQMKHTDDAALSCFQTALPPALFVGLVDPVWKTRLEAVEELSSSVNSIEGLDGELLVRFLGQRPGWRESNFQVFQRMLALIRSWPRGLSREAVALLCPAAVDKLADVKIGADAGETLMLCGEQVGFSFVAGQVLLALKTHKAPKGLAENLKWLRNGLLAFGSVGLPAAEVAEAVRVHVASANPPVRTASIQLAAVLRQFYGPDTRSYFTDLPAALMTALDAELTKAAQSAPPAPTRFLTEVKSDVTMDSTPDASVFDAPMDKTLQVELSAAVVTELVVPAELMASLGDSKWQTRKEALDQLTAMVERAQRRIRLQAPEALLAELRSRYVDTNKNLVTQALDLTGLLAEASRAGGAEHSHKLMRAVLPGCLAPLADPKMQVRQAALRCLEAVGRTVRLGAMLPALLGAAGSSESPNLRRELLHWLAGALKERPAECSKEEAPPLVTTAITGLQDRTMEVRRAAQALLASALYILPGEQIRRQCQEQRPALLPVLQPILDAHVPVGTTAFTAAASAIVGSGLFLPEGATMEAKTGRMAGPRGSAWEIAVPEDETILRAAMSSCLHGPLLQSMFSRENQDRLNAIGQLEAAVGAAAPAERDLILASLDLLLRWLTASLGNSALAARSLDLLERLLGLVDAANGRLAEGEAVGLLPALTAAQPGLRSRTRPILRHLCRIYPASRLFSLLAEGLRSPDSASNPNILVVCLEEMQALLARNGLVVLNAPKHVPLIASLLNSNPNPNESELAVRSAALDHLARLVGLMGEQVGRYLADMAPPQRALLEERLKQPCVSPDADANPNSLVEPIDTKPNTSRPFSLDYAQFEARDRRDMAAVLGPGTPVQSARLLAQPTPPNPFAASAAAERDPITEHPLDRLIHLMRTSPDLGCVQALQRLEDWLLPTPSTHAALLAPPRMDALLLALCVRLRDCCNATCSTAASETDLAMKSRLARYLTNALVLLASEQQQDSSLLAPISDDTLAVLLGETLSALTTPKLAALSDQEQLARALNILLVKTLENGRTTGCYRALLGLLEHAFRQPMANPNPDRYPEFVMKCLWKLTKQLPTAVAAGHIQVPELLLHCHAFLCALPPLEWKARAGKGEPFQDLPLRTLKTILHELVLARGPAVLSDLAQGLAAGPSQQSIPPASTFVSAYLRAMLEAAGMEIIPVELPFVPTEPVAVELASEEIEARLREICGKICSKPNTRLGLAELFAFQQEYPTAAPQIDAYLEQLGSFFYKYIRRNLQQLEQEHRMNTSTTSGLNGNVDSYKARLAQMQQAMADGGLVGDAAVDGDEEHNDGTVSPVLARLDSHNAQGLTPVTRSAAAATIHPVKDSSIVNLKERLARLRTTSSQPN